MIKFVLTLLLAAMTGNALATNINIGPNGCSLGDAIRSANNDSAVGACASGSGTDYIIAPDGWVVTLSSDLPTITSNMTIRSASSAGIFTISGDNSRRVLKITGSNTDVTLRRVEVVGGKTNYSDGAGIRIENATVRLDNSIVISNDAGLHASADGVYVTGGDLTLYRSTVQANAGVGVLAVDATVHVADSSFTNNSYTDDGYGLAVTNSDLHIEGSTFYEFYAISGTRTIADIVNSTIAYYENANYRRYAFDFSNSSSVTLNHVTMLTEFTLIDSLLSVSNSIIARCNLFSSNVLLDTNNVFHSKTIAINCLDQQSVEYSLLPLADNGGPTRTLAIADPDSVLINGGNPSYCAAVDQRAEARGATCDIGAYEATGFADLAVTARIDPAAPYVSEQHLVVFAEIENKGPGIATNIRFNADAGNAFVRSVNSAFCNTNPCVISSIQPGQTLEIPMEVNLYNYLASEFSLQFSAHTTATSTYSDANEDDPAGDNVFSLSHAINPGADLGLMMNLVTAGPYYVGQTIQYEALINNAGPQIASGTQLQFTPDHLDNVVFSGCASASGFTCNVSNIFSGSSRTVGIQAIITDDQFNAVGSVSATQLDINPDDNVDDRNNGGGVSESDITIGAKILSSAPYYSYDYLEFVISIKTGNEPASNVELDYDFPGAELIGIQQCSTIPCVIPQLPANSEVTLLAQFFAPIAIPGVVDSMNFHVVARPGQSDPKPSDNESEVVRPLDPVADVAARLSLVSVPPFYAGQEIQYALRVPNGGANVANLIHVTLSPQNLSFQNTYGDLCHAIPCTISQLNPFDEENMILVYRIDNAGAFDLTAAAHANEHDNNTSNNTDSSNNGGTALEPPASDLIFADDFE